MPCSLCRRHRQQMDELRLALPLRLPDRAGTLQHQVPQAGASGLDRIGPRGSYRLSKVLSAFAVISALGALSPLGVYRLSGLYFLSGAPSPLGVYIASRGSITSRGLCVLSGLYLALWRRWLQFTLTIQPRSVTRVPSLGPLSSSLPHKTGESDREPQRG